MLLVHAYVGSRGVVRRNVHFGAKGSMVSAAPHAPRRWQRVIAFDIAESSTTLRTRFRHSRSLCWRRANALVNVAKVLVHAAEHNREQVVFPLWQALKPESGGTSPNKSA
jgi:hypothetical protein